MSADLNYAIKFVADMKAAVDFHSNQVGFKLRCESPEWSEFETGTTTLALQHATTEQRDGTYELGFRVPDVDRFCAERAAHAT
jgi:hypothetical protein